eukprot:scaffold36289_cov16-Tisochrysis_lutea.AAC.1
MPRGRLNDTIGPAAHDRAVHDMASKSDPYFAAFSNKLSAVSSRVQYTDPTWRTSPVVTSPKANKKQLFGCVLAHNFLLTFSHSEAKQMSQHYYAPHAAL